MTGSDLEFPALIVSRAVQHMRRSWRDRRWQANEAASLAHVWGAGNVSPSRRRSGA